MILYTLACCALGYFEAILFHVAKKDKLDWFNIEHGDIHKHFVAVRIVIFIWCYGFSYSAIIHLLPCLLMFPMWHDGTYYIVRHYFVFGRISIEKFADQSKTTTAKNSYPFWIRFSMWLAGGIIWVFCL